MKTLASIALLALVVALLAAVVPAAPASAARAAGSFVTVTDASMSRGQGSVVVTATIDWNDEGVSDYGMDVGDLRLVAVSERGHLPFLLARATHDLSSDLPSGNRVQTVTFTVTDQQAIAAMRKGNRVVLTASQHRAPGQVTRSNRTYVTVAELQPFGSPQPNIGRKDCSAIPIVPGAILRHCDLVGAHLDGAVVSLHDPKANNCKVRASSTCLERADLTGATAIRADFSGANIAGGRMIGADLTRAKLDNFFMAGTEARQLIARGATSDDQGRDSGANMFAANLSGADLRDTTFLGISIGQARLDNTRMNAARWEAYGDGASFRGADLTGANLGQSSIDWADFARATLTGSSLTDRQLEWAWLCRTALPSASQLAGSRDCRTPVERARTPIPQPDQAAPYVAVDVDPLTQVRGSKNIRATVTWHASSARGYGMTQGTVRVLAVNSATGLPTLIATVTTDDVSTPSEVNLAVTDRKLLRAMAAGNRVVLSATQHQPGARGDRKTNRTYVTVAVLQTGPGLGRIGSFDCSRVAITADSTRTLDFCDLSGAMLDTAALNGRPMREVNLTGATAQRSRMAGVSLGGSRLAGLDASNAELLNISMYDAVAPSVDVSGGRIVGSQLYPSVLDGGDFTGVRLTDSPLSAASLRGTTFTNAKLVHIDLAFTDLFRAKLDGVDASTSNPSLFLADLTGADLTRSTWNVDETGAHPAQWATLCGTAVDAERFGIDGDRDCPF